MFGLVEAGLVAVFLFFYVGLFYNLPVLAAGVRGIRRSGRVPRRMAGGLTALPFFSLILPVKNEESVVGRLLEAFSRLDYPADRFEVVVVDDGSVDRTAEICGSYAKRSGNVRFFRREVSNGKANA